MNDEEALAWLGRKIGWGFRPGQWEAWAAAGPEAIVNVLVDGDAHGAEPRPDPFAEIEFERDQVGRATRQGVSRWMEYAASSPRPLETFMEFFWSDYFAVSIRSVRPPTLMFDHMNLLGRHALGNFAELLRDVTVDGAMLRFLDGATNTRESPNENYGRELLELYSVGVGNFSEDDVKAASVALTGWTIRRFDLRPRFVDRRHDDTPQTLLGVAGVHDVDTVIDAVLAHPATAERVVGKIAAAILGPDHKVNLVGLAGMFRADWELRPVVSTLLTLAIDGAATPSIVEPFVWQLVARRFAPGPPQPERVIEYFRSSGQIPLLPPNVGGFPEPASYLSTSATLARFNLASHLAERSATNRSVMQASESVDDMAHRLGLVNGFGPATRTALLDLRPGVDRVAAAIASPDLVVV